MLVRQVPASRGGATGGRRQPSPWLLISNSHRRCWEVLNNDGADLSGTDIFLPVTWTISLPLFRITVVQTYLTKMLYAASSREERSLKVNLHRGRREIISQRLSRSKLGTTVNDVWWGRWMPSCYAVLPRIPRTPSCIRHLCAVKNLSRRMISCRI